MPTFVTLAKWTDEGIRNIKDSPKRRQAFEDRITSMGGKAAHRAAYGPMSADGPRSAFEQPMTAKPRSRTGGNRHETAGTGLVEERLLGRPG
jgi:hypothetical protein